MSSADQLFEFSIQTIFHEIEYVKYWCTYDKNANLDLERFWCEGNMWCFIFVMRTKLMVLDNRVTRSKENLASTENFSERHLSFNLLNTNYDKIFSFILQNYFLYSNWNVSRQQTKTLSSVQTYIKLCKNTHQLWIWNKSLSQANHKV